MDFIKNNLKLIIGIVIGLTCATVVGATVYQYQATDVVYGNTNVSSAINDLYTNVDAQGAGGGINVKNYVGSSSGSSLTCPSGKICVAYVYCYAYKSYNNSTINNCSFSSNGTNINLADIELSVQSQSYGMTFKTNQYQFLVGPSQKVSGSGSGIIKIDLFSN